MRGERATIGKSLLDVQRELKIKATYIAAIENCDLAAFETQGFISGYVRSYARYLSMDPEWAYQRFCQEAGFTLADGMSAGASAKPVQKKAPQQKKDFKEPLANPDALFVPRMQRGFSGFNLSGVGSVLVLLALIGGLVYGGWSVLQEVQQVQIAPVDQTPDVVAQLDPMANVATPDNSAAAQGDAPKVPSADALDRLYRPQALDVPVMVPRDGPIAAINPNTDATSQDQTQTATAETEDQSGTTGDPKVDAAVAAASGLAKPADGQAADTPKVVADAAPGVQIFAVRPSWVRVTGTDGTVLFEKILDAGEHYAIPQNEQPAKLRAGNSGSVYFEVNGKTYGPASSSNLVVKNLALSAENLQSSYTVADVSRDPALAKVMAVADASATVKTQTPSVKK
ncbi:DUF4115 domain-containing protein [Thioclava sp. BHET1]|nr:DUF4115 domain-containing protein [Thioclava sp. BHET1]